MAHSTSHIKRKGHPGSLDEPTSKKAKKEKSTKHVLAQDHDRVAYSSSKSKSKSDEFRTIEAQMTVNIPPSYSGPGRPRQAVLEMLDPLLMQYVPNLRGVLLSHSNLDFLSQTAPFLVDSPFVKVDVSFTATIWSPTVGSKLWGTVMICSPDHIGLLIHKTFNASIPRHHIPEDDWGFEYGPLENDPEYADEDVQEGEDSGRWVHKVSGEGIGDVNRRLEFTMIGLSIADSMLSLIGSLQPDPFSPEHQPKPAIAYYNSARRKSQRSVDEDESVANALLDQIEEDSDLQAGEDLLSEQEGLGGDEDETDPFEQLGRETDELKRELARRGRSSAQEEEERRKEIERAEKKERKRKRREERKSIGADAISAADDSLERPKKRKKKDKAS